MSCLAPSRSSTRSRKRKNARGGITAVVAASEFVLVGAAIASTSMTLTRTKVFLPLRFWIHGKSKWLWDLITCWYCTSHWIAFLASFWMGYRGVWWFAASMGLVSISAIFVGLIIHSMQMLEPHPPPGGKNGA